MNRHSSGASGRLRVRDLPLMLKQTFQKWNEHDPFRQGAVIAYYAIFSLPALLVIIIAVAGFVFGREAVTGQLSTQIGQLMGQDTAKQIQDMIASASISKRSIWATILALVTLLLGATGVFAQLQKSLNFIWEVKAEPKKQWLGYLQSRLLSFGMVLSLGFLLIISLVITTLIALVGDWLKAHLPEIALILLQFLNFIFSFGVITVFFAVMFKFLPDAKIRWKDVWLGAIITSLLFSIGRFALGFYFGKVNPGSTYGAAGSVILIMLWVFYSCMIFFFGAEFTRQYAEYRGKTVQPSEHAVKDEEAHIKIKK